MGASAILVAVVHKFFHPFVIQRMKERKACKGVRILLVDVAIRITVNSCHAKSELPLTKTEAAVEACSTFHE